MALEEKSSLQAETRALKEKLSRCDSLDASSITSKKLLLLQSQMEQLQEENYRYKLPLSQLSYKFVYASDAPSESRSSV